MKYVKYVKYVHPKYKGFIGSALPECICVCICLSPVLCPVKGWVRECPGAPSPCRTVATALSHFVAHSTLAITITIIIIVVWPIKTGAHQFCRQKFLTHHHLKTDTCQGRQAHSTRMLPQFTLQSLSCAVCDATVATVHLTASCIIMFPDTESAFQMVENLFSRDAPGLVDGI